MYEKQTWIDGVSIANAERLNHIENGIGDNSEKISSKNFIFLYSPEGGEINSQGDSAIKLTELFKEGNKLSYEDNNVIVSDDVEYVRVSGNIFFENIPSNAYIYSKISTNIENVSSSIVQNNGYYASTPLPTIILNTKSIKKIGMSSFVSTDTCHYRSGSINTWLCVKVIKW